MTMTEEPVTRGSISMFRSGGGFDDPIPQATIAAATTFSGLFAGFFVAYQASVLLGLAELDDVTYVTTFQAINATISNFWFGLIFFGTFPLTIAALATHRRNPTARNWLALALGFFVVTLVITAAGNVPMNEELATVEMVTTETAAAARADFEDPWNRLNLIRTMTALAGFFSTVVAGQVRSRRSLT